MRPQTRAGAAVAIQARIRRSARSSRPRLQPGQLESGPRLGKVAAAAVQSGLVSEALPSALAHLPAQLACAPGSRGRRRPACRRPGSIPAASAEEGLDLVSVDRRAARAARSSPLQIACGAAPGSGARRGLHGDRLAASSGWLRTRPLDANGRRYLTSRMMRHHEAIDDADREALGGNRPKTCWLASTHAALHPEGRGHRHHHAAVHVEAAADVAAGRGVAGDAPCATIASCHEPLDNRLGCTASSRRGWPFTEVGRSSTG